MHAHALALYLRRNGLAHGGADKNLPSPPTSATCPDVEENLAASEVDDSDDSDVDTDVDSEQGMEISGINAEKQLFATIEENFYRIMSIMKSRELTGTKDRLEELERVNSLVMDIVSVTIGEEAVPRLVPQHRGSKRSRKVFAKERDGPVEKLLKRSQEPETGGSSSNPDTGATVSN
ncbi:hypothetical protein Aduo_004896 [Ancylostoma duodenale]